MIGPLAAGPLKLQSISRNHQWALGELRNAVADAAIAGGDEAKRFVSFGAVGFRHRTGETKRSTETRVVRTRRGALLKVQNRAKQARFLEGGTRPHRITARRAKALRFYSGGQLVFRRSVWHPGTKATWFLRKATERGGVRLQNELQGRMSRLALAFKRRR